MQSTIELRMQLRIQSTIELRMQPTIEQKTSIFYLLTTTRKQIVLRAFFETVSDEYSKRSRGEETDD